MKIEKSKKTSRKKKDNESESLEEEEIQTKDIKVNKKAIERYYDYYMTLPSNVRRKS